MGKLAIAAAEDHVTSRTSRQSGAHGHRLYFTLVAHRAIRLFLDRIARKRIWRESLHVPQLLIQRLLPQFPRPRLRYFFSSMALICLRSLQCFLYWRSSVAFLAGFGAVVCSTAASPFGYLWGGLQQRKQKQPRRGRSGTLGISQWCFSIRVSRSMMFEEGYFMTLEEAMMVRGVFQ